MINDGVNVRQRGAAGCRVVYPLLVVWALVVAGCPTYEDSHSGTYREVNPNPAVSERGAIEIDFFRYGDHAKAILRYFKASNFDPTEPFGEETFCTWTRVDEGAFGDGSTDFALRVSGSTQIPDGRLDGTMLGSGTMEATLYEADGEEVWETVTLEKQDDEPETSCEGLEEFLVRPNFNLRNGRPNRLDGDVGHTIENPVLTVQWVSKQRAPGNSQNPRLANVRDQGWAERISQLNSVTFDGTEFSGSPAILLTPPRERFLSTSGDTKFAVGHIVVIDDSTAEGPFRWAYDKSEPVVASALQSGVWPDGPTDADGSGKAILYVDGDIEELAENLGNFSDRKHGLQPTLEGLDALDDESEVPDRSFFIADIAVNFSEQTIVQMEVLPLVTKISIPVQATERYLKGGFRPLPRLLP